jgi:hypothetical protein
MDVEKEYPWTMGVFSQNMEDQQIQGIPLNW